MASFDFDYLEKHAQDYADDEKPASENLSGENDENANDLAILGSGATQGFTPSRAYASGVPLLTGDELLDTKMASGKMSKYDIYTAQKAGIPVMAIMQQINANVNLDAKVRNKSSSTTNFLSFLRMRLRVRLKPIISPTAPTTTPIMRTLSRIS